MKIKEVIPSRLSAVTTRGREVRCALSIPRSSGSSFLASSWSRRHSDALANMRTAAGHHRDGSPGPCVQRDAGMPALRQAHARWV